MNEKINEELKSEYDLNDKDNLKISKNEKNFLIEKKKKNMNQSYTNMILNSKIVQIIVIIVILVII